MKTSDLNYKHLLYFWTVAKEGSVTRAADALGLSPQAVSTQVSQLERDLGVCLFSPSGRSLALTESGRSVLAHADEIFLSGERLVRSLSHAVSGLHNPPVSVGITDHVPKILAFRLLSPLLDHSLPNGPFRISCKEGDLDSLLSEMAVNRIDLVVSDRPAPAGANFRPRSLPLSSEPVSIFASPELASSFPGGPDGAPFLMPSPGTDLRSSLDEWMAKNSVRVRTVAEFSDSALMKTFGRHGAGMFPAPSSLADDILSQYRCVPVAIADGVFEEIHIVHPGRRMTHPAVSIVASPIPAS